MSTHRASAPRQRLDARIEAELGRACHPAASVLADAIRARHGDTVAAVLFYGSCLRQPADQPAPPEGILDFYVIVDRSEDAYDRRWLALAGRLLPPNVFYLERPFAGSTIRAKYAVVTMAQFLHGTSARCFHPSLWARFAQPVALLYARDDAAGRKVAGAVSAAVITMLEAAAPLLDNPMSPAELWKTALSRTYGAELRPEKTTRASLIYEADRARYDALAPLALEVAFGRAGADDREDGRIRLDFSAAERRRARRRWLGRRLLGKPLSLLRLIKSAFTFDGGVDYALWKVTRHTGVQVTLSPFERRHPILNAPVLLWRLYRLNAVR
jgi:hypothetical protein